MDSLKKVKEAYKALRSVHQVGALRRECVGGLTVHSIQC